MRVDRPTDQPEDPGERAGRHEARPQGSELRDANGLNAAEYTRAWNEKVESGEAEQEQAVEEGRRREVDLRDSNGMTAAELRFLRNKQIDEAEDETSEEDGADGDLRPRRSVVTDAQGRTGAEIRFQQAKRAEEAARAGEAEVPEPEPASEGDDKPEKQRGFKTLTEEFGESRSFSTFDAARKASIREHGPRPGQDLHHLVERSQARPERSGFTPEQIHSSDNLGWLDRPVHEKITARYNKGVPGFSRLRDSLDGLPFETQHAFGRSVVDEEIRKYRGDD